MTTPDEGVRMELTDYFALMRESNAGVMKIIPRDKDDKPMGAAIFVDGPEADEILAAVEAVEAKWENEP